MPRKSTRARLIREYAARLHHRLQERYVRIAHCMEDKDEDNIDGALLERLQSIARSRYLSMRVYRKQKPRFSWFITQCSDREFLRSFRMNRESFVKLVELIKEHRVFAITPGKRRTTDPACQLMAFLKYIGTHDSDACFENLGALFGVSSGSCFEYIKRITTALMKLYDDVVRWPSVRDRKAIADRINASYDVPNCIGVMDGTLLPLAFKPAPNGEDYFTRKGSYALNALICCDDRGSVIYTLTGWPGSTHDNRVWTNSKICRSPDAFFSYGEYLLGDSAFRASQCVVPPFKKLASAAFARDRDFFNIKLVKICIRTEHCIGLIKGRFQRFKGVRTVIRTRRDLKRIIRLFSCVIAVHNLLVNDPVPPELEEMQTECANEKALTNRDESARNDVEASEGNVERREQLFHYLVEKDGRF